MYLIPASSAEDQKLIDLALESPGLEEADIEMMEKRSLEGDIKDLQTEMEAVESEIDDLDSVSDRRKAEDRPTELEQRKSMFKQRLLKKNQQLEKYEETLDNAQKDFTEMQTTFGVSQETPIQCWPVEEGLDEQQEFDHGDLLLFYTGNNQYKYMAIVDQTLELSELGSVILDDTDRSRPLFLILSDVFRIQVDSTVIAKITDRDLESVQKVSALSRTAREELAGRFDNLPSFVEKARSGISTLPPEPSTDESEGWTFTKTTESPSTYESTSTETMSAGVTTATEESSTEPIVSPPEQSTDETPETIRPEPVEQSDWQVLAKTLQQHKQVVLIGPQGTGKRRAVEKLLSEWMTENGRLPRKKRILRTQFNTNTDYSEFVLGQIGDRAGDSCLVTGRFGQFVDIAAAEASQYILQDDDSPPKYVAVIEDFHKASPAQVFGDFWRALRPDNRGKDNPVRLSGATANLWIPEEFYILGIVDTNPNGSQLLQELTGSPFAVRRTSPDYAALREWYGYTDSDVSSAARDGAFDALSILALEQLNRRIRNSKTLDDQHVLGQMFLSKNDHKFDIYDSSSLYGVWQYDIFTVLAGYHKDGLSGLQDQLFPATSFDGTQVTLGALHNDPELVGDLVESLAEAHSDY